MQRVLQVTLQWRGGGSDFNIIKPFPYLKIHCLNWNLIYVAVRRHNRSVLFLVLLVWGWVSSLLVSWERRWVQDMYSLSVPRGTRGERREIDVAHIHWGLEWGFLLGSFLAFVLFCTVFWVWVFCLFVCWCFIFFLTFFFRIRLWWKKLCKFGNFCVLSVIMW